MPEPGDKVYLGSILCNVHCWGIVSDIDTPSGMMATFEILGNDGAVTFDALVGPPGPPGDSFPIVKMQYTSSIDTEEELPEDLTNTDSDKGKAWWIGNQVYVWGGTTWMIRPMGTQGPPGPIPEVTATIELLDPDDPELSTAIVVTGPLTNRNLHFKLKAPRGPAGPGGDWGLYEEDDPPQEGDVPTWNGTAYAPFPLTAAVPQLYSIPQNGFTSYTGATTRHQIATMALPPQQFPWTPMIFGHIRAIGVELDADPLILGCEVRIGHPSTGELVARGFGNSSTWTTIVPHYSTPTSASDAITPDNGMAVVPAEHSGSEGTVYVNLFNDGLLGTYNFDRKNAQLSILIIPLPEAS